jgi:spore maturation protein CgeB
MDSGRTLMIVGQEGATNIGDSLRRAAAGLGWGVAFCDASEAYAHGAFLQRFLWHFAGRRPLRMARFNRSVEAAVKHARPLALISTGLTPLTATTLLKLKTLGIRCLHYSTDDPWNPGQRAQWFLQSLPIYDHIFSTRRSNFGDFHKSGCANVTHLPFGFDQELFFPDAATAGVREQFDILFVGGADNHRASLFNEIAESGLRIALCGDYWNRYAELRQFNLGRADVPMLRALTTQAPINLCVCRRANRDSHVMRSFEIPAIGGFMIAEDTQEHREFFGEEGTCVLYFVNGRQAIEKAKWAMERPLERRRMALAAHERVVRGDHTYGNRLQQMLKVAFKI